MANRPSRRAFLRAASTGPLLWPAVLPATHAATNYDPKKRNPRGTYNPRGDYDPRGTKPPRYDPRGQPPVPKGEVRNHAAGMAYAPLGKTGFVVSRIAFDCSAVAYNNRTVLEEAIARGVNLLYLAPARSGYGVLRVVRDVLAKHRARVFVALEAEPHAPDIKRCLRELGVKTIDLLLAPVPTVADVRQPVRRARFQGLQKDGSVRFLGLRCAGPRVAQTIQAAERLDHVSALMVPYPLVVRARDLLDPYLARARTQKLGVIGQSVFAGPLDPDHVVPALRDLYRRGVVDTALIAFGSHVELRTFLRAASRAHR